MTKLPRKVARAARSVGALLRDEPAMNRLADSRRDWLAVKAHVDAGHEGMGPGLTRQARANYESDLLARIESLMDARAGTPEGDELRKLADEWAAHEQQYPRAP